MVQSRCEKNIKVEGHSFSKIATLRQWLPFSDYCSRLQLFGQSSGKSVRSRADCNAAVTSQQDALPYDVAFYTKVKTTGFSIPSPRQDVKNAIVTGSTCFDTGSIRYRCSFASSLSNGVLSKRMAFEIGTYNGHHKGLVWPLEFHDH